MTNYYSSGETKKIQEEWTENNISYEKEVSAESKSCNNQNTTKANQDTDLSVLMQISAGSRAEILRNQRAAAQRRRQSRLQSGLIRQSDGPHNFSLFRDPNQTPAICTFSQPKILKQATGHVSNEGVGGLNENVAVVRRMPQVINRNKKVNDVLNSKEPTKECNSLTNMKTYVSENNETGNYRPKIHQLEDEHDNQSFGIRRYQSSYSREDFDAKGHDKNTYTRNISIMSDDAACLEKLVSPVSLLEDENAETERTPLPDNSPNERISNISAQVDAKDYDLNDLNLKDSDVKKEFIMRSIPKTAGMIHCFIQRGKGIKNKMYPEYRLYLKQGNIFLLCSKKRSKKQTSNYLISIGKNDYDKNSDNIVGKLRSNFLGTEFQILDSGANPKHVDPIFDDSNESTARLELGGVLYTSNVMGRRGPRKMQVCIGNVDENGHCVRKWQPVHRDEEMVQCFKHKSRLAMQHLLMFENRQPKWNEDMCAYVLNFNGRVTMASVKNFQLIQEGDIDERVVLQFGRISKDEFTMDVQWPMSIFQAFSIALSSCDSKIACD